jgi:hypothetical protein
MEPRVCAECGWTTNGAYEPAPQGNTFYCTDACFEAMLKRNQARVEHLDRVGR